MRVTGEPTSPTGELCHNKQASAVAYLSQDRTTLGYLWLLGTPYQSSAILNRLVNGRRLGRAGAAAILHSDDKLTSIKKNKKTLSIIKYERQKI